MSDYRGREPYQPADIDEQIDAVFADWCANLGAVAIWAIIIACAIAEGVAFGAIRW